MIETSRSTFSRCFNCPLTCVTAHNCNNCTRGSCLVVPLYYHVPEPPLPKKEKLRKFIEKKNWKAIQDKHSRR